MIAILRDMVTQMDPAVHSGSPCGELGADGESDTQTVPSMDGESGASAVSGEDPRGMWELVFKICGGSFTGRVHVFKCSEF